MSLLRPKDPSCLIKPPQALSPHGVERVVVGNKVWQCGAGVSLSHLNIISLSVYKTCSNFATWELLGVSSG